LRTTTRPPARESSRTSVVRPRHLCKVCHCRRRVRVLRGDDARRRKCIHWNADDYPNAIIIIIIIIIIEYIISDLHPRGGDKVHRDMRPDVTAGGVVMCARKGGSVAAEEFAGAISEAQSFVAVHAHGSAETAIRINLMNDFPDPLHRRSLPRLYISPPSPCRRLATIYDLYIRTDVLWREVQWNVSSGTCGPVLPYFWRFPVLLLLQRSHQLAV